MMSAVETLKFTCAARRGTGTKIPNQLMGSPGGELDKEFEMVLYKLVEDELFARPVSDASG